MRQGRGARLGLVALVLALLPGSARAQEVAGPDRPWFGGSPWAAWDRATGDWGGSRSLLEARGIVADGTWTYDLSTNLRGGLERGTRGRGLFLAGVTVDLERLVGLRGATATAGFMTAGGQAGGELTGDAQSFSNIDAEAFTRRGELWYEQRVAGDRLRAKVGYVDANSEFASVGVAGEFINSSAGFSPTMYAFPTYPEAVLSASLFVTPARWLSVGAGVFEGSLARTAAPGAATDAPFGIVELALTPSALGRLGVGGWRHRGWTTRFDGSATEGPWGWYAFLERRLTGTEGDDSTAASGLSAFVRYGWADERVNVFGEHLMAGAVLDAPFGWAGNALGVGVSHVDLSDQTAAGYTHDETSLEAFLRVRVAGFLTLRPDVQYLVHPGGAVGVASALVTTLRVETVF